MAMFHGSVSTPGMWVSIVCAYITQVLEGARPRGLHSRCAMIAYQLWYPSNTAYAGTGREKREYPDRRERKGGLTNINEQIKTRRTGISAYVCGLTVPSLAIRRRPGENDHVMYATVTSHASW